MNKAHMREVHLDATPVGKDCPTYFVAEIGNNHNGSLDLAIKSIEAAAKAGANAVKFQKRSLTDTFAKELLDRKQTNNSMFGKSYHEYRQALELDFDAFVELKKTAEHLGVSFFATPFDLPSVEFLERVGIPFYKISSFDVTNIPLIAQVALTKKPIILSTGMCTPEELLEAVNAILCHHDNVILLHCVSVYPSPDDCIKMATLEWLNSTFPNLPVGYSGHEQDILPSIVAISRGACLIERHFTLSRSMEGPDHATVSIEPDEFESLVKAATRIKNMIGLEEKCIQEGELDARYKHGKSVVSSRDIPEGTQITEEMLTIKSPGYGVKFMDLPSIIGRKALTHISADTVICPQQLSGIHER